MGAGSKRSFGVALRARSKEIPDKGRNDFDTLYQWLTSKGSREAPDSLFSASAEELGRSHRPGGTEKP
jgi:hypothetical protein